MSQVNLWWRRAEPCLPSPQPHHSTVFPSSSESQPNDIAPSLIAVHPANTAQTYWKFKKSTSCIRNRITLPHDDKQNQVMLQKCMYTPNMAFILILILCITSAGASVIFKDNFCTIIHPDESVITKVTHTDGLYCMSANVVETINNNQYMLYMNPVWRPPLVIWTPLSSWPHPLWSYQRCNTGWSYQRTQNWPNNANEQFCKVWAAGKPTTQPFLKESLPHASNFRECVHWDLWEPASVKSLGGKSYAAVQKDDATHMVKPYFLAKKSETFSDFKEDEELWWEHNLIFSFQTWRWISEQWDCSAFETKWYATWTYHSWFPTTKWSIWA